MILVNKNVFPDERQLKVETEEVKVLFDLFFFFLKENYSTIITSKINLVN